MARHLRKWSLTAMLFLINGCTLGNTRVPVAFVVPQNYVGWIRVKYKVPNAPPLPIKNGYYIARIPNNGLLKTSIGEADAWGSDKFYYVDKMGIKTLLPSDGLSPTTLVWGHGGGGSTNERRAFIGTKKQFDDAQKFIGGQDPGPLRLPISGSQQQ